jgi:hypothetical protein
VGEVAPSGVHRCTPECARPVRCIICNRLKCPTGEVVPAALEGMRCDERCFGYLLDPQPGHLWPVANVLDPQEPPPPPPRPAFGWADQPWGLVAWALHQTHPPAAIDRERRPVEYRIACLLVGERVDDLIVRLVRVGCTVAQTCEALGSVILQVRGDPLQIIAELDAWDGPGTLQLVPPPPPGHGGATSD